MQEIPLSATPSLPNHINSNDPPAFINVLDPPHISPQALSSKIFPVQAALRLQNSHLSLRKNEKPLLENNHSMPQLCFYPKTQKVSECKANIIDRKSNSNYHQVSLTKNSHTSSLPILPHVTNLNLPPYPLKPNPSYEHNPKTAIPVPEEKFCKICFENSETKASGKLITPCKCTGTVRFIHEECLKTWQVSQGKDIKNAECEICHCRYVMEFKMGLRCYPRQAIDDGLLSLISSLCLFVLIVTLISIIVIFSIQLNDHDGIFSKNKRGDDAGSAYKLGILISCCLICFILSILFILSLKEACFISQVTKWSIFNYNQIDQSKDEVIVAPVPFRKRRKVFPRSNSDNTSNLVKRSLNPRGKIQTKIVKINITHKEIKEENSKENPNKTLIKSPRRDYQQNLIRFSSITDSEKSEKNKAARNLKKPDQTNLIQFSENTPKQSLEIKKGITTKKYDLLRVSSIKSSKSDFPSKEILKEHFADHLPKDYINMAKEKEKIIDVVINKRKTNEEKSKILLDFLPFKLPSLREKKSLRCQGQGGKKNLYLFKKQTVFMDEKSEAQKSKRPFGFESNVKK